MDRMERSDASRTRDQAGIGPHAKGATDLVPLGKLDGVRVAQGDADIRGWEVCTLSGTKVGTVHELLVDRVSKEIVMLDVDLAGSDRHTMAPIRAAQIDRVRRVVILDSADLNGPVHTADSHGVARTDDVATRRVDATTSTVRAAPPAPPVENAASASGVEEVVVERRPVVYEETVVRRRTVDPAAPAPEEPRDDR